MTVKGMPSATARRVAAYRVGFERVSASFGDPAADEALAHDVAQDVDGGASESMGRYLSARTAFFDRVVVNAIKRGVTQIVNVGAGYDGRSLRYAVAGVRWWEIDQADTQADKLERLERLNLDARHVCFVAHDLAEGDLAEALLGAGYASGATGLFICEGVAVYLEDAVLARLLTDVRAVATIDTRLALSLGAAPTSDARPLLSEGFEARVAVLGEPAVGSITARDVGELLPATRWRPVEISERARRVGFVVAAPLFAPTSDNQQPTVGPSLEGGLRRTGTGTLAAHIEATYGVPVTDMRQLDLGVHRVERADRTVWVARVFPAARAVDAVRADAATLDWLADQSFPGERCAAPEPVSVHDGQPVLVTEFLAGAKAPANPGTFESLGRLLAGLHSLRPPAALRRAGGAWHHLVTDAGLSAQKAAAIELVAAARPRVAPADLAAYGALMASLEALDDLADLPHGLAHPDPVPVNLIVTAAGPALVDWTGTGWAPRLASLGWLLWAAASLGDSCLDAAIAGYRTIIQPDPSEVSRLEQAMTITPLVLTCWSVARGRQSLERSAARWTEQQRRIALGARRAHERLTGP